MSKWARVVDGVVQETLDFDPEGRFPEEFVWVSCPKEVECHWTYDAAKGSFAAFVTPAIPEPQPELPADRIGEGLPDGATIAPPLNETQNQ